MSRPHRYGLFVRMAERTEIYILIAIALIVGGVWAFVELADEVLEGETHSFDEAVLLALRHSEDPSDPVGPAWVEELGRDLTALGGVGVLTIITASAAGFLWLQRKRRAMYLLVVAIASGLLVSSALKHGFDRPRPDLVPHEALVYTASFPSGHSMLAAVTYLTLGALLARVQPNRRLKIYLLGMACLLTILVGLSRVYLGVHWPTDVLAGWTMGAVWALLFWLLTRWLQHRGRVDSDSRSDPAVELGEGKTQMNTDGRG